MTTTKPTELFPPTWYVKRLRLRRLLAAGALAELASVAELRPAPRRALLFAPDGTGDRVWWLEDGRVRLCGFLPDGREVALAVLEEHELFGEEPHRRLDVRRAYAEVLESGHVWSCPRAEFERVLAGHSESSSTLARQIARQLELGDIPTWAGERRAETDTARVASTLRLLLDGSRRAVSPQMIAFLAGVSRERLLEILVPWIDDAVVDLRRDPPAVIDPAALDALGVPA